MISPNTRACRNLSFELPTLQAPDEFLSCPEYDSFLSTTQSLKVSIPRIIDDHKRALERALSGYESELNELLHQRSLNEPSTCGPNVNPQILQAREQLHELLRKKTDVHGALEAQQQKIQHYLHKLREAARNRRTLEGECRSYGEKVTELTDELRKTQARRTPRAIKNTHNRSSAGAKREPSDKELYLKKLQREIRATERKISLVTSALVTRLLA